MPPFLLTALIASVAKLLLAPAYTSTDFEVHRNWLSITYQLPLGQWYHEATSQWTLDYPPLFACFECALARVIAAVHPQALIISAQPYNDWAFTLVHRGTVVAADVVLLFGASALARATITGPSFLGSAPFSRNALVCMVFFHPGLLIVDHVHFQYNGFLIGVLLFALACIVQVCNDICTSMSFSMEVLPCMSLQGKAAAAAVSFAVLLCLKHTFVYAAPLFAILIFQSSPTLKNFLLAALAGLSGACYPLRRATVWLHSSSPACAVMVASVAPFLAPDPIAEGTQMLRRLFPFGRGLLHEYWAPNVWALYASADKVVKAVLPAGLASQSGLLGTGVSCVIRAIETLIQFVASGYCVTSTMIRLWRLRGGHHVCAKIILLIICSFSPTGHSAISPASPLAVLPSIQPWVCGVLVALGAAWTISRVLCGPKTASRQLIAVFSCYIFGFMFGWHVHEKAILVPLLILACVGGRLSVFVTVRPRHPKYRRYSAHESPQHFSSFVLFSSVATYSLFPLLFRLTGARFIALRVCCFLCDAEGESVHLIATSGHDWLHTSVIYLIPFPRASQRRLFSSFSSHRITCASSG